MQRLATALREAFPTATIVTPLSVLGEGFGSVVVETANGIVFRIAKHAEAQRGHQREHGILPIVQRVVVGLRVPVVEHFLDSSPAFPFGVFGYAKLPGRPVVPADIHAGNLAPLARQVAEFLGALHGIEVSALQDADLPEFPPSPERLTDLRENVLPYLAGHLQRSEYFRVQRRLDDLENYKHRYPYAPTLVHGDCWYENLLYDEARQRLVGVIDFENVAIGDAAIDLATQRYLGDQFAQAVIEAYYSL